MKWIFLIIPIVLLGSCKAPYHKINIDILEPAIINIPSNYTRAIIYNAIKPVDAGFISKYYGDHPDTNYITPRQMGSLDCMKGLIDALSESPRFQSFIPVVPEQQINILSHTEWDKLQAICREYNCSLIICLESFEQKVKEHIIYLSGSNFDDLNPATISEYHVQLIANSRWCILDPFAKKIIDTSTIRYMEPLIFENTEISKNLGVYHDSLEWFRDYAYAIGLEFGHRIAPKWRSVTRHYYAKGNKEMEKAAQLFKDEKWEEAASIWQELYKSGNSKLKDKAALNLALSYEIRGMIWKARLWALRAYRINGTKEARNYVNELFKRSLDEHTLDKQMGFD